MKKLIFIFVILFVLIIVTGCSARKNTVHFNPIEASNETDEATDTEAEEVTDVEDDLGPDLAITSFIGDNLDTSVGYHIIRGATPKKTSTIKINDYKLSRYYSGQTEWSYIASSTVGTLKEGENSYTVHALDAEGNEIGSKSFTINYEAPDELPNVGSNGWMALIISFLISIIYFATKRLRKAYIKNI